MVFYASFHAFNQWYLRVLVVDFRGLVQTSWNSWHLLDFTPPAVERTHWNFKSWAELSSVWGGTQIILLMVQKTQATTVWMFKHEINCQPQLGFLAGFLPSTVYAWWIIFFHHFSPPRNDTERGIASWVEKLPVGSMAQFLSWLIWGPVFSMVHSWKWTSSEPNPWLRVKL